MDMYKSLSTVLSHVQLLWELVLIGEVNTLKLELCFKEFDGVKIIIQKCLQRFSKIFFDHV